MKTYWRATLVSFALLSTLGCGNNNTEMGREPTENTKTLVEQRHLPVGNLNCPLGGLKIVSGVDRDGSGSLQPDEITSIRYQCTPSVPRVDETPHRTDVDEAANGNHR